MDVYQCQPGAAGPVPRRISRAELGRPGLHFTDVAASRLLRFSFGTQAMQVGETFGDLTRLLGFMARDGVLVLRRGDGSHVLAVWSAPLQPSDGRNPVLRRIALPRSPDAATADAMLLADLIEPVIEDPLSGAAVFAITLEGRRLVERSRALAEQVATTAHSRRAPEVFASRWRAAAGRALETTAQQCQRLERARDHLSRMQEQFEAMKQHGQARALALDLLRESKRSYAEMLRCLRLSGEL